MRAAMFHPDLYWKMGTGVIKKHGFLKALARLFYLRRDFGIWRQDLTVELPEVKSSKVWSGLPAAALEFRHVFAGELAEVWPSLSLQTARHHQQFLSRGYHCFAALQNGKVIGWVWWSDQKRRERDCVQRDVKALWPYMLPREVYIWDAFVPPEYRCKGIYVALHVSFCHFLKEKGYEKTLAWTYTTNIPAIRTLQRFKNEEIGRGCTERYLFIIERVRIMEFWGETSHADS